MSKADSDIAVDERWNHNIHYHPVVLDALPDDCRRVLDVGCGEGLLTLALSRRAEQVVAIDQDESTLDAARQHAASDNIEYVLGDVLTPSFAPASFDAVVTVAVLHHLGLDAGLRRIRRHILWRYSLTWTKPA